MKKLPKAAKEVIEGVLWGLLAVAVVGWVVFAALWAVKPL